MQFVISGRTKAGQQLARMAANGPVGMANGLVRIAETGMTASKRDYVPVDTGALRASGFVESPVVRGSQASIELGFGGPAAPYAITVHEDLLARHTVGQAKYLETPLRAHVQGMPAVLAAQTHLAIRAGMQRLVKAERAAAG